MSMEDTSYEPFVIIDRSEVGAEDIKFWYCAADKKFGSFFEMTVGQYTWELHVSPSGKSCQVVMREKKKKMTPDQRRAWVAEQNRIHDEKANDEKSDEQIKKFLESGGLIENYNQGSGKE
jgi:hypothetical protein